ncbi:MAG: tetratricopeptide repeat protein [Rhizobacter sp.]
MSPAAKRARGGAAPKAQPPAELTLEQALTIAMELQVGRHYDDAEEIYTRVLQAAPDHPDALHLLGVLHHMRGNAPRAIELIRRATQQLPEHPDFHNNLGNVLLEAGRYDEAEAAYLRVLQLTPERPDIQNNLGVLRRAQGRVAEAEQAYRKAIEMAPGFADAHHNLGNLYEGTGRADLAVRHFLQALVVKPKHEQSRRMLGVAYYVLGRLDEAAAVYREWLKEEPDNPMPRHHLAACTGQAVPDRAADGYVEAVFDGFANSFDAKLAMLTYRAPQVIADELARHERPERRLRILDAGCGTGLCGPLLAPYASRLIGVDLSGQMLAKAELRHVYDELVKAELTAYLHTRRGDVDAIVSADTLCYFGALEHVAGAAHGALARRGLLLFTVEAHDDDAPFMLRPHGRYTHGRAYVEQCLQAAGFDAPLMAPLVLRQEAGLPVNGWLVGTRAAEGDRRHDG